MTFPFQNVASDDSVWAEIEKTCRRISFLRAVGRPEDAERVRSTDLAAAAALIHQKAEDLIREVQENEQRRADDAVAFAEQLAPTLARHAEPAAGELKAMRRRRPLSTRA